MILVIALFLPIFESKLLTGDMQLMDDTDNVGKK